MAIVALIGFLVAGSILVYMPVAQIVLIALRRRYYAGYGKTDHIVCLTFDDGPNPVSTPLILDILRARRIRATFFVLGRNVKQYPEIIAAMIKDGHEICEHGYCHLHPWKTMPWSYFRDLLRGHKILQRLLGSDKKRQYRPTYGKANALTFAFVWLFQKALFFWNVDPHDYRQDSELVIVQHVISKIHAMCGAAIVLLHDGRTGSWKNRAEVTAAAVDTICDRMVSEGYQFRTSRELILREQKGKPRKLEMQMKRRGEES